jgi:hypothetical protein
MQRFEQNLKEFKVSVLYSKFPNYVPGGVLLPVHQLRHAPGAVAQHGQDQRQMVYDCSMIWSSGA